MKKIIGSVVLIVLAFGFFQTALAHEYQTDGSVTVLLHSNPDDDPIVAEPAALFFQMTDTANRFNAANCECSAIISNQGKKLFAGPLLRIGGASIYGFTVPFTFPKKAVYNIAVTGKPKVAGAFQSFQVQYDLRVDRAANLQSSTNNYPNKNIFFIVGLLAIIAGLGIYFKSKKINYRL